MKRLLRIALLAAALTGCDSITGAEPVASNAEIFDQVWTEFDRRYSFFDLKRIDWNASRAKYRPAALAARTDTQLAGAIWDMLDDLHDVHVTLSIPSRNFTDVSHSSRPDFFFPDDIVFKDYVRSASSTDRRRFRYGIVFGDIGYIWIPQFGDTGWAHDIDDVLAQLNGTRSIIIDVRSNGGGATSNSDRVASRFVTEENTYSYVRFRNGPRHDQFTALIAQKIAPTGKTFTRPVAVLTNRHTFSAAESFVLSLRTSPRVVTVGDTTGGGSGNPLPRELPNGWRFQVPQWIQYDLQHKPIEDNGIAPDIYIRALPADREVLRDRVLEGAAAALRARGG